MKNEQLQKNIPNGWKQVKLSNISRVRMGQSPSSSAYNEDHKGLPLIQGNNDIKNHKTITRIWTSEITKTAEQGEIILTVRAPVGIVGIAQEKICMGRGVCSIDSDCRSFIWYFLNYFELKWLNFEQGSTFTAVSSSDIKNLKIIIPSLSEQNRIIAVLETWDKVIEKIEKKIKIKKQVKKWLMQNLLSEKKRLSGFIGEWDIVRLGDVSIIKKGDSITKKSITHGSIPVIAGGQRPAYFHDKSNRDGRVITVSASGAYAGYVDFYERPIFVSDCTSIQEKSVNINFIYYLLKLKQEFIYSLQSGGAQPHIQPDDLKRIIIKVPKLKEEQDAIVNIITIVNKEILELENKISLIKDQKKYLLDNLITGKIRTPETLSIKL